MAAMNTPMPSKRRSRFGRSASMGFGRSGTNAAGSKAAHDNGKENNGVSVVDSTRRALSMRHSFGRVVPPDDAGPVHDSRRDPVDARRSLRGIEALAAGGDGGSSSGVAVPGNIDRTHINNFKRAHSRSGGGETYLALNEGRQQPLQYQSSGGVPMNGSIWRRPMIPYVNPASAADFQAQEPGGNTGTAAEPAETGLMAPHATTGWMHDISAQLDASHYTTSDGGLSATLPFSPGGASEMSSPSRLIRTRASTNWQQEMKDKARVVMRRNSVVDRKNVPTVSSQSRRNSGAWSSLMGSTSSRSQPVTVTVAAPPSNTDTDTGGGLETGDGAQRARGISFATQPEMMLVSPTAPGSTAAATHEASPTTAPAPATGGDTRLVAAKTALLRGPSSSSFEAPCEMERLVPSAEHHPLSPAPAAAEQPLAPSNASTAPTSKMGVLDDVVERESFRPAVVAVGGTGGVETLAPSPTSSFEPIPSEPVETEGVDARVHAAGIVPSAGRATAGDTRVAPTEVVGGAEGIGAPPKARPPSCAELNPSETASSASVTTLAVNSTRGVVSSVAVTPSSFPSAAPAVVAAEAPGPARLTRPPNPYHRHSGKHPLASMGDLLTSCFAFVDATDGNSNLPVPVRKEMKRNAIAAARKAEVSDDDGV